MGFRKQLKEGLLTKNPVLVQMLGMCSTLAISTSLFNGLGMGIAVTVITICSNMMISALRKVIPSQVRIAAYITIIAGFVTIIDLLLKAYIPTLSESLGLFIPLIVVNCIVLGRAEGFASASDAEVKVAVSTTLTQELIDEGNVREVISKVQTMRKDAGFNVTDHIRLSICGGEDLYRVVRENESEICGQVLADELVLEKAEGFVKNWNINGMKADIGVERL